MASATPCCAPLLAARGGAQIAEIASAVSGQKLRLPIALRAGRSQHVLHLRQQIANALGVGVKQIIFLRNGEVVDLDNSVSLAQAWGKGPLTYSCVGADVYKDSIDTPRFATDAFAMVPTGTPDGDLKFPEPTGINVNMMPILPRNIESVPNEYRQYWPFIQKCASFAKCADVAYLTINEGEVEVAKTQRRGGVHIEAPGYVNMPSRRQVIHMTFGANHESFQGGIFMASSVAGTTAVWGVQIKEAADVVAPGGDLEHVRSLLPEEKRRVLEANELVWITEATPHEALPMRATSNRSFFRLVTGDLSAWHELHNTKNPLGVVPDPESTKILKNDKFDLSQQELESAPAESPRRVAVSFDGLVSKEDLGLLFAVGGGGGGGSRGIRVSMVLEGEVQKWNSRYPESAVRPWDRLLAANGFGLDNVGTIPAQVSSLLLLRGKPPCGAQGKSPDPRLPWEGLQCWFDTQETSSLKLGSGSDPDRKHLVEWRCRAASGHSLRQHANLPEVYTAADGSAELMDKRMLQMDFLETSAAKIWVGYLIDDGKLCSQFTGKTIISGIGAVDFKELQKGNIIMKKDKMFCVYNETSGRRQTTRVEANQITRTTGFHLCELLLYDRLLSHTEISSVFAYFSEKSGAKGGCPTFGQDSVVRPYPKGKETKAADKTALGYHAEYNVTFRCAVADTSHGKIAGKAYEGTCWYSHGGQEFSTDQFTLVRVQKLTSEPTGSPHGHQTDGGGDHWCAVANTPWGKIPGKCKKGDSRMHFPYEGKEHLTDDFQFVHGS